MLTKTAEKLLSNLTSKKLSSAIDLEGDVSFKFDYDFFRGKFESSKKLSFEVIKNSEANEAIYSGEIYDINDLFSKIVVYPFNEVEYKEFNNAYRKGDYIYNKSFKVFKFDSNSKTEKIKFYTKKDKKLLLVISSINSLKIDQEIIKLLIDKKRSKQTESYEIIYLFLSSSARDSLDDYQFDEEKEVNSSNSILEDENLKEFEFIKNFLFNLNLEIKNGILKEDGDYDIFRELNFSFLDCSDDFNAVNDFFMLNGAKAFYSIENGLIQNKLEISDFEQQKAEINYLLSSLQTNSSLSSQIMNLESNYLIKLEDDNLNEISKFTLFLEEYTSKLKYEDILNKALTLSFDFCVHFTTSENSYKLLSYSTRKQSNTLSAVLDRQTALLLKNFIIEDLDTQLVYSKEISKIFTTKITVIEQEQSFEALQAALRELLSISEKKFNYKIKNSDIVITRKQQVVINSLQDGLSTHKILNDYQFSVEPKDINNQT